MVVLFLFFTRCTRTGEEGNRAATGRRVVGEAGAVLQQVAGDVETDLDSSRGLLCVDIILRGRSVDAGKENGRGVSHGTNVGYMVQIGPGYHVATGWAGVAVSECEAIGGNNRPGLPPQSQVTVRLTQCFVFARNEKCERACNTTQRLPTATPPRTYLNTHSFRGLQLFLLTDRRITI